MSHMNIIMADPDSNGTDESDLIAGTKFVNHLNGGLGDDAIYGYEGDDVINGEEGHDKLAGGKGHDIMTGGEGNDRFWGEDGNDTLSGDSGNDQFHGGAGNDVLTGGTDDGFFNYQSGDPALYFLTGDWLESGAGKDIFVYNQGDGVDQITDFDSNKDTVEIHGYTAADVVIIDGGVHDVLAFSDGNGGYLVDAAILFLNRADITMADFVFV